MHLRLSTAIGLPIVNDAEEHLGFLGGILINPDTAVIEGFFVYRAGFFSSETLFLPVSGIEHWGSRIRVRHNDALSPLDEFVRLSRLQEEGRPIIGQVMMTDTGRKLGRCADVQFDTRSFRLEWLFPRMWLRWRVPVPVRAILQVKPEAVMVREEEKIPAVTDAASAIATIETLASTPAARLIDR
jgi:uncharacterized protein YrrD